MKVYLPILLFAFFTFLSSIYSDDSELESAEHPELSEDGFEVLDLALKQGKSKHLHTEGNWQLQDDGSLKLTPRKGESGWQRYGSYLWITEPQGDFVFDFEYQHGKGGNSGVYFRVADQADATESGFEVQILDCYGKKKLGQHDLGGVIKTAGPLGNASKPAGEWNRMTVSLEGSQLTVILNGKIVQKCDVSQKKPKEKTFAETGWITIQDHGEVFSVRNLQLKSLGEKKPLK